MNRHLTDKELAQCESLISSFADRMFSTDPTQPGADIQRAVNRLYERLNTKVPKIIYVPSPYLKRDNQTRFGAYLSRHAINLMHADINLHYDHLQSLNNESLDALLDMIKSQAHRSATTLHHVNNSAYILAGILRSRFLGGGIFNAKSAATMYSFIRALIDLKILNNQRGSLADVAFDLMGKCDGLVPYEKACLVIDNPSSYSFDDNGVLHNPNAAALQWRDGTSLYALQGQVVPDNVIVAPHTVALSQIELADAEPRRVIIDHVGLAQIFSSHFAGSSSPWIRRTDDEYGALFRMSFPDDEDLVAVRVENATPEADGTYSIYWLRVPPHIVTAREAVGWTFNRTRHNYHPVIES